MTERAGSNYTKEDLRHFHLSDYEIEEITGHKLGDGEEPNKGKEIDNDVVGKTPTGEPIYKADDPGEMYKPKDSSEIRSALNPLLNETPLKDRRYLKSGTTIERDNGGYRRGHIQGELIVKRLPENKTVKGEKNFLYEVLNTINYGYTDRNGKRRSFIAEPGETFYAPMKCENKEKWEKLNGKK